MNGGTCHIISLALSCFFLIYPSLCSAQFSLRHDSKVIKVLNDKSDNTFILDDENSIYVMEDKSLTFFKTFPSEFKLVQTEEEILIFDNNKLYSFNNFDLIELIETQSRIISVSGRDEFYAVHTEKDLEFWSDETKLDCAMTIGSNENLLSIWKSKKQKFILTELGVREVCNEDEETIISKAGLIASCAQIKSEDEIYVGTSNRGIWTYKDEIYKQSYIPGINFPARIKKLLLEGDQLWILDHDGQLYLYNQSTQIYQKVESGVDDFCLDKWNTLYMISNRDLIKNVNFVNSQLPDIAIQKMFVGNSETEFRNNLIVKNGDALSLRLKGNYSPHDNVKFQYKLDQKDWIETGPNLKLNKLKEGSHSLQLRASANNKYFTKPISINFKKQGSIFNSIWPFLFGGTLLLLIFALLSQRRMLKENAKLQSEREKMNLQIEVLKSKQQFGQLQLNPHFLFNTLNSINGLIALNENKKARQSLNNFSQMMRSVLDNSFKESIPVDTEIRFLEKYLSLEKLIRNDKFEYEINSEVGNAKIPPMIVQPFIENAIIHGIKHKEGLGKLDISFEEDGKYITVKVEDDGIGREAAQKFKSEGHHSSALKITIDRLKTLDKWNTTKHLRYEDLENPSGTKVIINIPKQ